MSPMVLTIAMFGSLLITIGAGIPLFGAIGAVAVIFGLLVGGTSILPVFAMRVHSLITSYSLGAWVTTRRKTGE